MAKNEMAEEVMTVDITLEDDKVVKCSIVTIFTAGGRDYIALLPLDEQGENTDGEVWLYRYSENPDNPNEEPELDDIETDEEYEIASDAFDEFLDASEFDELVSEDE